MARTRRRQYSDDLRSRVVYKWKEDLGSRTISKHLAIPRWSVRSIIKHYKTNGHWSVERRPGRPRLTDARHDRRIIRAVEKDRFVSAARLAAEVSKEIGKEVSSDLIRDRIHEAGLFGRSARKKPFLSAKHRRQRLKYAKCFDNMQPEWWSRVLFSDEASVELHGTSGRVSVWRRPHEAFDPRCVISTRKSSRKSLMVWSSVTANGVGTMHFCEKSFNGEYYRELLRKEMPFTKLSIGLSGDTLFVHDNAPAHTAKLTTKCVRELQLISLGHPPQSPDLNPMENLWFLMKKELNKDPTTTIENLKTKLLQIWTSMDDEVVRNDRAADERKGLQQAKGSKERRPEEPRSEAKKMKRGAGIEPVTLRAAIERSTTELPARRT
ncbi:hypothetical protein PF005_g20235 [Phytophthora fragariae]|uniref:Tc1-like transposase DDE domain-containing protein n=1 Tax=Phytophthora fragariae TaxID=53985 RepID=A0A6A3WN89_9STRA|nr:hypothetical protein PF005_g20235 [Phytophthora fragariae]